MSFSYSSFSCENNFLRRKRLFIFICKIFRMTKQEKLKLISEIFNSIENEYEESKSLNKSLVQKFFDELKKFDNSDSAIREFTWLFGIDESERHFVESKECRKIVLVDLKKCRKLVYKFIKSQS